MNRQSNTDH